MQIFNSEFSTLKYIEHLEEIRPISFGDIVWPVDGTCIKNGILVLHRWLPFANGTHLICQSPSHSPMLPLICQKSIYLPKEVSFANFTSHLPFAYYLPKGCLISRFELSFAVWYYLPKDCLSFPDRKSHLPLSTLSFSKPSPTFTKRGRKNIFNTPKWLPWTRKSNCRAL